MHYEDRQKKFGLVSSFGHKNKSVKEVSFDIDLNRLQSSLGTSQEHYLSIKYMRTYHNAGAVHVSICDKYIATLDALWPDFATNTFSTSYVYSYHLNPATLQHCLGSTSPTVSVEHFFVHEKKNPAKLLARTAAQKVKLESVFLCRVS